MLRSQVAHAPKRLFEPSEAFAGAPGCNGTCTTCQDLRSRSGRRRFKKPLAEVQRLLDRDGIDGFERISTDLQHTYISSLQYRAGLIEEDAERALLLPDLTARDLAVLLTWIEDEGRTSFLGNYAAGMTMLCLLTPLSALRLEMAKKLVRSYARNPQLVERAFASVINAVASYGDAELRAMVAALQARGSQFEDLEAAFDRIETASTSTIEAFMTLVKDAGVGLRVTKIEELFEISAAL